MRMFDSRCNNFEKDADATESKLYCLGGDEQFLDVLAAEFRETGFFREVRLLSFERPESRGSRGDRPSDLHASRGPFTQNLRLLIAFLCGFRFSVRSLSFAEYLPFHFDHFVKQSRHVLNRRQNRVEDFVEACRKAGRDTSWEDEDRAKYSDSQLECHWLQHSNVVSPRPAERLIGRRS